MRRGSGGGFLFNGAEVDSVLIERGKVQFSVKGWRRIGVNLEPSGFNGGAVENAAADSSAHPR